MTIIKLPVKLTKNILCPEDLSFTFDRVLGLVEDEHSHPNEYLLDRLQPGERDGYSLFMLSDLMQAAGRSEALMKQKPLVEKVVASIFESLFVKDDPLFMFLEIAFMQKEVAGDVTDTPFLYGGRHRLAAIQSFIYYCAVSYLQEAGLPLEEETLEKLVNGLMEVSPLEVTKRRINSEHELMELIFHSNGGRKMSTLEQTHIEAQAILGLSSDPTKAKDVDRVLSLQGLPAAKRKALLVRTFLGYVAKDKRLSATFKEATWSGIGKQLASFMLDNPDISPSNNVYKQVMLAFATDVAGRAEDDVDTTNKAREAKNYAASALASLNEVVEKGEYLKPVATKKAKSKQPLEIVAQETDEQANTNEQSE